LKIKKRKMTLVSQPSRIKQSRQKRINNKLGKTIRPEDTGNKEVEAVLKSEKRDMVLPTSS
jgi:hypothetical protein